MCGNHRPLTFHELASGRFLQLLCVFVQAAVFSLAMNDAKAGGGESPNTGHADDGRGTGVLKQVLSLPATDGSVISLGPSQRLRVAWCVFLGAECPLANLYAARLNRLAIEFKERGVRFIGINSNLQDSMAELGAYAKKHELVFPLVKDYDRAAALGFGASRTPEVFVVDPKASFDIGTD